MPSQACVYEAIEFQAPTFMRASFHARNLVLVAIAVIAGCVGVPEGIEPVTGFQVERYMGRWYEVARLDHRFERGMEQITATYELRPDGTVKSCGEPVSVAGRQLGDGRACQRSILGIARPFERRLRTAGGQ